MGSSRLTVLGVPRVEVSGRSYLLDRKTAALLVYLAVAGPTARSRLAGSLWPTSAEATARNNLSQSLRRLRRLTGANLIEGDDPLRLGAGVSSDIADLKTSAFAGRAVQVLEPRGALLDGFDFDDIPAFADWLYGEREALFDLERQTLTELAAAAEAAGRYGAAVTYARRLVELDPVAETAHRRLIRLIYLTGDRGGALKAYRYCRDILDRELGVEPLPETQALAHKIEQGELTLPPRRVGHSLPVEILRPPVLVGREEAWEAMEAAWDRGQVIFIRGEPGVGKTRLAQEFLSSKGCSLSLGALPGRQDIPFAAAAELARSRLDAAPHVRLPDWVASELARIMPEYQPRGGLKPLPGAADRLRFFQAYLAMAHLTGEGFVATLSDDVQYYDQATAELVGFLLSQTAPTIPGGPSPRSVVVYRRGELPDTLQVTADQLAVAGLAATVDLEPFDTPSMTSLLVSLNLDDLPDGVTPGITQALHRRTGGNALFLLETLRNLIETGALSQGLPRHLPVPAKVEHVVRMRLSRLSPTAQRLVQAAAVLRSEFDLSLVGALLNADPLGLVEAWEEVERAHVFRGNRFSHDLLQEAALGSISQPVRTFLDRRAAEVLARATADPGRIAGHYLAAGAWGEAGRYFVEAAHLARRAYLFVEAEGHFAKAADLFDTAGDKDKAFEALFQQALLGLNTAPNQAMLALTRALTERATTAGEKGKASEAHARLLHLLGRHADAAPVAAQGAAWAAEAGDPEREAGNLEILGTSELVDFRLDAAQATFVRMRAIYARLGNHTGLGLAEQALGNVVWHIDHHQALAHFAAAGDQFRLTHQAHRQVSALNGQGFVTFELGDAAGALALFGQAQDVVVQVEGEVLRTLHLHYGMSLCHHALGDYAESWRQLKTGIALGDFHATTLLHLRVVHHYLVVGALAQAADALERATAWPSAAEQYQFHILLAEALLAAHTSAAPKAAFGAALEEAAARWNTYAVAWVKLERARFLEPDQALDVAQEVVSLSEARGLAGMRSAALTRAAQALLRLGQPERALKNTAAVSNLPADSIVVSQGERLFTHAQALAAAGKLGAPYAFQRARAWLLETAEDRVPTEQRQGFLQTPLSRRILAGAATERV